MTTTEYLKDCLADAPPLYRVPARPIDLLGWWTSDGYYVCADCAGRIMTRGCRLDLHGSPEAVYEDEPFGVCVTCDRGQP